LPLTSRELAKTVELLASLEDIEGVELDRIFLLDYSQYQLASLLPDLRAPKMSYATLWRAPDRTLGVPRRRGPFHITVALGMPGQWATDTPSLTELRDLKFSLSENILPDQLPHYYNTKGVAHHFDEMISPHSTAFLYK